MDRRILGTLVLCGAIAQLVHEGTAVCAQPPASDPLLEAVAAAWKKREEAAKAVRVVWKQKDTHTKGSMSLIFSEYLVKTDGPLPATDASYDGKGSILLDGKNARITVDQVVWDVPTKSFQPYYVDVTCEGGVGKRLDKMGAQSFPSGSIGKAGWVSNTDVSQWPILAAFRGTDSVVMNRHHLGIYNRAVRITVAGVPLVEVIRDRSDASGELKLLVDPSQDYLPRKSEEFSREGVLQRRLTVTNRKDASGVWVPMSWSVVSYRGDKLIRHIDVVVLELMVSPPITSDDFKLTFPVGTKVYDKMGDKPRDYIIRENDKVREIPPQELTQKYDDLVRSEPGELVAGPKVSFWTRNTFLWLGGVLVVVGVLVFVIRGRRRKPASGEGSFGNA